MTRPLSAAPLVLRPAPLAMPALIVGALAIGSSPILVRLSELPPTATAFWRVALAAPVLYLLSRGFAASAPDSKAASADAPVWSRADTVGVALAGVFLAADLACLHWSLHYTSVTNAILLLNLAPFFVAFASWAFYREPVTARFLLGLVIAVAGLSTLMGGRAGIEPNPILGNGLGFLAGAFYGGYMLVVARYRLRLPTLRIMAVSSASCAVALLPLAYVMGERLRPETGSGVLCLVGLAVVTHAGGQGLIAYAMRYLSASTAAATLMLQPIAAAMAAWLVFSEALGPWQLAGAAFVMVGILVGQNWPWSRVENTDTGPRSAL